MSTIKILIEELEDLKRLRIAEINAYKEKIEYLSMFKPETKSSKILAWVLPIAMFLGTVAGTIYFFKNVFIHCG